MSKGFKDKFLGILGRNAGAIEKDSSIIEVADQTVNVGTSLRAGRFFEEYLGSLMHGFDSYVVYDKMRRSDPQIVRILRAMNTPILGANFGCQAFDTQDEEQARQADFKTKILNEWMSKNWVDTLYEILSYLPIGFCVVEPIFEVRNDPLYGKIVSLNRLQYMKQKTIREWRMKDGRLDQIRQIVMDSDNNVDHYLDASNLIVFTNQKEGDNYEGVSILRGCYGSYVRKDLYYKINMIGIEKMAIGTPIAYISDSIRNNKEQLNIIKDILETYCAHESQGVILPDAMKGGGFVIEPGKYDSKAVKESIELENTEILDTILASFLDIGTKRAGGNAQVGTLAQMFMDSLHYIGDYIASTLDPVVHKCYALTFGEPKVRLKISCSNLNKRNEKEFMDIVSGYVNCGAIRPDKNLEIFAREAIGAPDIDEETQAAYAKTEPSKNTLKSKDQNNIGE